MKQLHCYIEKKIKRSELYKHNNGSQFQTAKPENRLVLGSHFLSTSHDYSTKKYIYCSLQEGIKYYIFLY